MRVLQFKTSSLASLTKFLQCQNLVAGNSVTKACWMLASVGIYNLFNQSEKRVFILKLDNGSVFGVKSWLESSRII